MYLQLVGLRRLLLQIIPGKVFTLKAEKRNFSVIGTSVRRVDGADKVTGRARYAGDLIVPGMIEGKFLRSPY
ncbi:MAG TPA: hypothetical protein VJQ48_09900, partial [Candidatus Binatia bacterium]|nr:hypothetical protein [Candidatus Binatia bacterium]